MEPDPGEIHPCGHPSCLHHPQICEASPPLRPLYCVLIDLSFSVFLFSIHLMLIIFLVFNDLILSLFLYLSEFILSLLLLLNFILSLLFESVETVPSCFLLLQVDLGSEVTPL